MNTSWMRRNPWGLFAVALLLPFIGVAVTLTAFLTRPPEPLAGDDTPTYVLVLALALSVLITLWMIVAWFASDLVYTSA
jgi:hypothetical protein